MIGVRDFISARACRGAPARAAATGWFVTLVVLGTACASGKAAEAGPEFAGVGHVEAWSETPPGIEAPLPSRDLEAISERGRILAAMDRALTLGWIEAERVGIGRDEVVLPLVDVDPGLRSGQVVFVRWPKSASEPSKPLATSAAHPWLLVSLLLAPDGVVDVELLSGALEPDTPRAKRVEALLTAARALPAEGRPFRLFALEEEVVGTQGPGRKTVTRVYALSSSPTGPDLEFVVDKPRRRDPMQVVQKLSVHAAGGVTDDRIMLEGSWPAAATVVRALQRGSEQPSEGLLVSNAAGLRWTISTQDGRIAREASGEATDVKP